MKERVLYIKGGRAVEEARMLFPRLGELPDGGPDKFLLAVIYYVQKARLSLVTFSDENLTEEIMGHNVREYAARPSGGSRLFRRFAFLTGVSRFFRDALLFRADRVLCGMDGPLGVVAWLIARLTGAQFVFLVHNALNIASVSRAYRVSNHFLCGHADVIMAHGPFLRLQALSCGAPEEKVVEFQNGLDPADEALLKTLPAKLASEGETLAYVGRVEIDKGATDLMAAFVRLAASRPLRLKYVGTGSANAEVVQLAAQAGVSDRVEVLGGVPFFEVFRHLREAALVITPSRSSFPEGLCKTALEAFYVGTPVVGPDYGPFPLVIQDGVSGLLYKADSVASLEQTIARFFDESGLRARLEVGALEAGRANIKPHTSFHEAIRDLFADGKSPA